MSDRRRIGGCGAALAVAVTLAGCGERGSVDAPTEIRSESPPASAPSDRVVEFEWIRQGQASLSPPRDGQHPAVARDDAWATFQADGPFREGGKTDALIRFGLFTDHVQGSRNGDGTFIPAYREHPVWSIWFKGNGHNLVARGGMDADPPGSRFDIVGLVDATTGRYLTTFNDQVS